MVGVVATLGYMYVAGKQTKREEGPASMYSASSRVLFPARCSAPGTSPPYLPSPPPEDPKGRDTAATSDAKLSSSDVQAVVHGKMKP